MKANHLSIMAGAGAVLLGGIARLAVGAVQGETQAVQLIGSLADSGLYLGSGVATASATMLALMLTLLGLTRQVDNDFDEQVYRFIYRVSALATLSLLGAIILLLALTLPINEFEGVPSSYYPILYNVLFGLTVLTSALLVTTVVLLYETIRTVIASVAPLDDI